ncbi:MAG: hypothetical protein IT458_09995 [Planctomycetes bacterium]|nr:hypothetical protein [Planctomycetota bacterium]
MRTPLALLLLCLLCTGCILGRSTENEPLPEWAREKLVPGKTTAAEVVQLFGAPVEVVALGRRSAWRYEFKTTKYTGFTVIVLSLGHIDTRSDRAWVFFDENQVVYAAGTTLSSHRTQYALPWEDVHEAADNEARDRDRWANSEKPKE